MLTYVIVDKSKYPNKSTKFNNGLALETVDNYTILPYSSNIINTYLILQCNFNEFLHFVIDDNYSEVLELKSNTKLFNNLDQNTLKIEVINKTNKLIYINSGTLLIHVDSKHINDYTTLDKTLNNIKVENLNADTKKTKLKSIATNLTNDIKLKDKIRNRIKRDRKWNKISRIKIFI